MKQPRAECRRAPATGDAGGVHLPRRCVVQAAALVVALGFGVTPQVRAHDFWIQPQDYSPAPGASTPLTLQVGHAGAAQRSALPLRRISRFVAIDATGRVTDLRSDLRPGGIDDGRFALQAGVHQLVLESDTGALSHLPAARFNAHLEAEGLTPALEHRKRTGRMQDEGSERYGRASKALVRVGAHGAHDAVPEATDQWLAAPVGLPLEIALERSPYAVPRPSELAVRVYYDGAPLAAALVKLGRLDGATRGVVDAQRTDQDGRASLALPEGRHWLATVTWTRVLPDGSATEYETLFSSLTFLLDDDAPG